MESVQHVSTSSKALFSRVHKIVPPLLEKFHKAPSNAVELIVLQLTGQQGRVAVIGGCADYTGAPYFSAMASARLGCDMSHVICERSAATVIKSYSPNLMVHPLLASSDTVNDPQSIDARTLASPIINMLSRLHVLVIGPGLGRDGVTLKVVAEVIREARLRSVPFILDADGLTLITSDLSLIRGYNNCIVTPNVNEFKHLAQAAGIEAPSQAQVKLSGDEKTKKESAACEKLANALGGITIIQKGPHDVISNGLTTIISDVEGGYKRSGGQGDTLTGSLGTLMAWRAAYHNKLWDSGEKDNPNESDEGRESETSIKEELETTDRRMSPATTLLLVAYAGSGLTRESSRRAFRAKRRSMQASDLTDEVYASFLGLIGEPEASKSVL